MTPYYDDGQVVIYHGDCREVLASIEQLNASVVVADPPYGETALRWDRWPEGWVAAVASAVSETVPLWCFGSMRMFLDHRDEFVGWRFAQDIVWEKQNGSGMHADRFKRVHEHVVQWYRGRWGDIYSNPLREPRTGPDKGRITSKREQGDHLGKTGMHRWEDEGTRMVRSVLRVQSMHQRAVHPTEKPVGIVAPLLEYSARTGTVLDPFVGSGTTLVAAKQRGLSAIGIEAEERYCEIAAKRCAQGVLDLGGAA